MARPSPPLLFLCLVALTWVGARMTGSMPGRKFASPERSAPWQAAAPVIGARRVAKVTDVLTVQPMIPSPRWPAGDEVRPRMTRYQVHKPTPLPIAPAFGQVDRTISAEIGGSRPPEPDAASVTAVHRQPSPTLHQPASPIPASPPRDRWSLSAWAFARPDSGPVTLGRGLLGGSQAGLRATRRIDRRGRIEAYARLVSSGRIGDGTEGALGVSVQPVHRLPVRLSVERREQLAGSGGRAAFAAFASGGVDDAPLPLRFRLDVYAAAGMVGAQQRDLFAEGAATVRRPAVRVGTADVEVGAGAWAAVQPGLERVDVGPSISARWRIQGISPRLSVDWRQRVAGDAAPRSGAAITLAADF